MIFLDNSSTSHKKPKKVLRTYYKTIKKLSVNPSRGAYPLSIKASLKILQTRQNLAKFFNADNFENIIFTSGCTESINLALIGSKKNNGNILTTCNEHNSVLRTLSYLKNNYNISSTHIKPNKSGEFNIQDFEKNLKSNSYLVIVNHTSNVNGHTININEIGNFCKKHNLIFIVDAAQSAGHTMIDIKKNNINLLCVAGHKGLLSPQGIGVLVLNKVNIKPIKFGGTGTESINTTQPLSPPEGFEAGTQNLPSILALNEGVKFVQKNFNKINTKIHKLTLYLITHLNNIDEVKIYNKEPKSGVVAINLKNRSLDALYSFLNSKNICTRNGLHCAPLIHKYLNTIQSGLIRISIGYKNSKKDINKLIKAIKIFISKND